jgi:thiol peroxidase
MERQTTTMGGNLLTLIGPELKIGDKAPDFTVRTADFIQVSLDDYRGKGKLISVAPSLETTVCDKQTRRFNKEAARFADNVKVLSVSMDLPFALKRWSQTEKTLAIDLLSDHLDACFGLAYGLLIKELRLLNRAVVVIDGNDAIQYVEVVSENDNEPNYAAALAAVKRLG